MSGTFNNLLSLGSSVTINGAIFTNEDAYITQPAGSGVIQSFVRIQNGGVEDGYNYDGDNITISPPPLDDVPGNFTKLVSLAALKRVVVDGVTYVQFRLDINENSDEQGTEQNPSDQYISLDQLKIYASDSATLSNYDPATGQWSGGTASLAYNMDGQSDQWVGLNYLLAGSGQSDMAVLVPLSAFGDKPYVYLYSSFGEQGVDSQYRDWGGSDGYEEWFSANGPDPTISGTKWLDVTGDGITPDDIGLAGVTIFVDKNDNGTFDAGTDISTETGSDGRWSLTGFTSEDLLGHKIYEVLPEGYAQTVGAGGVALTGDDQTGIDFANFKLFDISGTKWKDITGNGITADDTGLAGVTVFIDKNGNGTYDAGTDQTTTTGSDGTGSFSDLSYDMIGK